MKIVEIQWHNYRLPFRNSFITAHGVMTAREGIIVQITTERGISGIGEIAPLPAGGGAALADACSLLPALAAHLQDKTPGEALELLRAVGASAQRSEARFNPSRPPPIDRPVKLSPDEFVKPHYRPLRDGRSILLISIIWPLRQRWYTHIQQIFCCSSLFQHQFHVRRVDYNANIVEYIPIHNNYVRQLPHLQRAQAFI